eukprot:gnl/MRDRNA2_/MRDRNA2_60134_c0_seq1.p1 gnl/MRDRNA2_/MRDRNA2_60134_c0~~gnl/MRDRNA2_/MRDRNA2_60134_c0_seq1.p1  ORF type:complete len:628 (+),score=229.97 gnl/MRDRNA2_/MRDRNA2_60134_c0_seq1:88-1884(+)
MADLATAKYLEENIGPCLAKGLAAVSTAQPADAIAYLANWLQQYADTEDAAAKREMEQKLLEEERAKKRAEQKAKEAKLQKKLDELAAIDKSRDDLVAKFEAMDVWSDEYWKELIAVVKAITGAKSVYVGIYEDIGEGNAGISYEYAPDQPWMLEKRLDQGKGVTHGVFTFQPSDDQVQTQYLYKPKTDGDPGSAEEGAVSAKPYLPVYVACVTDCPEVVYFDMTRLGSFLACPIVYSSYYSDGALKAAVEYETLKAEQEAEAQRRAEAAENAEGEGEVAETEEPAKPAEEIVLKLPGSDVKMVIAMDTLGTNIAMDTAKIAELQSLCDAIGRCKTRSEEKQVDEQAIFVLDTTKKESIDSAYMQFCTEAKEKVADAFQKEKQELDELLAQEDAAAKFQLLEEVLGKSVAETKGDLLEKRFTFLKARDVVVSMKEYIMELTTWVVVGNEMKSIIAACALLVGFKKESVYMKKKSGLFWEKLMELLSPALFETLDKVDVSGVRKELQDEQKLAYIKPLAYPGEFSEQNADELSPAFKALFVYVRAAFEYRYAEVKLRKAEMEAKEKAAAEGGEEGAPPPPEVDPDEIDDDFADIANIVI